MVQVLVEKCLGRRLCSKCKKDFNLADIYLEASNGEKAIVMPPLPPPDECLKHMEMRSDDKEETIKKRLKVMEWVSGVEWLSCGAGVSSRSEAS